MEDQEGLAGQVFISYVREDSASVDGLQGALEVAGIRVWRDTADLRPGDDWRARIRRVISGDARVFLACFSRSGLARERSYQREELILAIEELRLRGHEAPWLIPVRFDDCPIPDWSIGAGRTLDMLQGANLFGAQLEEQTSQLVRAVALALGHGNVAAGDQDQATGPGSAPGIVHGLAGRGEVLPVAAEVTDRAVLGIHPAIPLPADADPSLPEDLPLYVPRDIDPGLRSWVRAHSSTGGFLLLTGPAAAGKTRTAYQLISDTLGDWPLLIPASARQLERYIDADQIPPKLVIWLNETHSYLGPGGLTAGAVRRMLAAPQPVIIVGTIWPDRYDTLTAAPGTLPGSTVAASGPQPDAYADSREILIILADRRDLQADFSPAEQHRAASLSHRDPRIAEALADPDNPNLAEALAAGPQLISRWLMPANPYGAAVITAAITARRCGHPEPVPARILKPLAERAMTPAQRATATRKWFNAALEWAREPVRGHAAPLMPQATMPAIVDGDSISDILVQHAARNPAAPWHSVPDDVWMLLIEHASPIACQAIAAAAYPYRAIHHLPIAQRAARKAADAGHAAAMTSLAILMHEQGHVGQARYWHRRAAMSGDSSAMYNLAFLLAEQGDNDQAQQWYQQAAHAGHFGAMSNLAALLRQQGHAEQAEHWQRKAFAVGQIREAAPETRTRRRS